MLVDLTDGKCRSCGGQLEILDADDCSMSVTCVEYMCRFVRRVEPDAFGDGLRQAYYFPIMTIERLGGRRRMMHSRNAAGALSEVESPQTLAHLLTQRTWTLCSAFFVAGREDYLFLNDATSEDGAGEFAIVKRLADGTFPASGIRHVQLVR